MTGAGFTITHLAEHGTQPEYGDNALFISFLCRARLALRYFLNDCFLNL